MEILQKILSNLKGVFLSFTYSIYLIPKRLGETLGFNYRKKKSKVLSAKSAAAKVKVRLLRELISKEDVKVRLLRELIISITSRKHIGY